MGSRELATKLETPVSIFVADQRPLVIGDCDPYQVIGGAAGWISP